MTGERIFLIESTSFQSNGQLIMTEHFDFCAFKRAVEQRDVLTWAGIFADDAEWIEYKPNLRTHLPRRMIGKEQVVESINQLKAARSCDIDSRRDSRI